MLIVLAVLALGGATVPASPATAAPTCDPLCRRVRAELAEFTGWLAANGARGFIGEVGWPSGPAVSATEQAKWNALGESWYRDADAAKLWVTAWATGEWWGTSYPLSVWDVGNGNVLKRPRPQATVIQAHPTRTGYQRGVSVAGGEFGFLPTIEPTSAFSNANPGVYDRDYHYDRAASFKYLYSRGVRLVRLAFRWERLQPTLGGALDPAELARLRSAVDRATAAGLKVVLDMHNFGAYYRSNGTQGVRLGVGSSALPHATFADTWRRIALAFADKPGVTAWGIMCEPVGLAGRTGLSAAQVWEQASQAAVTAIRSTGDARTAIVPGYEWSAARDWTDHHPDAWITGTNILYEAHHYWDHDNSGTYTWTYAQEKQRAKSQGW